MRHACGNCLCRNAVALVGLVGLAPNCITAGPSGGPAKLSRKWWSIGPFASGKAEYDGDPLEAHGGVRQLFERGPGSGSKRKVTKDYFFAEHVDGGQLEWRSVDAQLSSGGNPPLGVVALPHEHVPFRGLMNSPPAGSASDVLHVQYWVVGSIRVKQPGRFEINSPGIHTFELALAASNASSIGPIAGNIYSEQTDIVNAPISLPDAGLYHVFARVRGKVPLHFSFGLKPLEGGARPLRAWVKTRNLPDVVLGNFIAGSSVIDVRVRNMGSTWLNVYAEALQESASRKSVAVHMVSPTHVGLAPGTAAQVPVRVSLGGGDQTDREATACVFFNIALMAWTAEGAQGDSSKQANLVLPVRLRCRKSTQSAVFAFLDVDGSVATAAVLRPRQVVRVKGLARVPIVVSFPGVGVEPQGQADAYKMKLRPDDRDYTFGFDGLWVLVPHRDGPHNWEDVGMRSALRAIDVLAAAPVEPRANPEQLIIHGHSRGGHGALGLATRIPDRVLGVASACGWYSREEYGDANNLWVHETSLMHMDKMLLGLLHASIAENENSIHASNLRGMRVLVRTGTRDKAVPPWFSRRMARHLHEEGANVTFQEFDQEHWWWDSKQVNDGGVMHDVAMRSWTYDAAAASKPSLSDVLGDSGFVLTATSPEYVGRFGVRVLQRVSPASRAFVRIRWRGGDNDGSSGNRGIELVTANVRRLGIAPSAAVATASNGAIFVDNWRIDFDIVEGVDICRDKAGDDRQPSPCSSGVGSAVREDVCTTIDASSQRHGVRSGRWQRCGELTGTPPRSRGLAVLGPIRRVFAAPWAVVVPDDPTPLEMTLAAYFATGHLTAVGTSTQTLTYSAAGALRETYRFVWLGRPGRFPAASRAVWPLRIDVATLEDEKNGHWATLSVDRCVFREGHGAVFTTPAATAAQADSDKLDLVITATGPKALRDLVTYSFATNQAHTRAPMSNMLPDFFVTGPEFLWRGYGGVVAAGYWDAEWQVASHAGYFQC